MGHYGPTNRTSLESIEVFVQSFPDPATRYQVSNAGGTRPRWRHDGQELFFISPDGTLMATTIRSNDRSEVGTPTKLFRTSTTNSTQTVNYEVAPDGQRFLTAEVVNQASRSPITVLLNWNPPRKNSEASTVVSAHAANPQRSIPICGDGTPALHRASYQTGPHKIYSSAQHLHEDFTRRSQISAAYQRGIFPDHSRRAP